MEELIHDKSGIVRLVSSTHCSWIIIGLGVRVFFAVSLEYSLLFDNYKSKERITLG